MLASLRLNRLLGLLLVLGAIVFLSWTTLQRVERVNQVTTTDAAEARPDASSSTGYAHEKRWLIVPEHHTPSYERIAETQQMLATGTWRVRHVDYDNAPEGRPVYSSFAYRWWLGGLAGLEHMVSNRPIGVSVERAAVWSEPLLHFILLLGGGAWVARAFGLGAAVWFVVATAFLFPLAGSFLPAVPDDRSLGRLCAFASVLPLLAALRRAGPPGVSIAAGPRRYLSVIAGVAGGLGLWIDAPHQTWIILGTAVGAVLAHFVSHRARPAGSEMPAAPLPWRAWAWAGALTSVVAYLVEYAPSHLGFRLEVNHPLYAVAWIGLGELLRVMESRPSGHPTFRRLQRVLVVIGAAAAAASLPVALVLVKPPAWFSGDLFASRLTNLPDAVVATNFAAWLNHGWSGAIVATVLPLAALVPAVLLLFKRTTAVWRRRSLALVLGPIGLALLFALMQLEWWSTVDILLLALLVVLVAPDPGAPETPLLFSDWRRPALAAAVVTLGFLQLRPEHTSGGEIAFSPREVEALIERAAAHWIAERAGTEGAVALLPPHRTIRWCYHGGSRFRGIGSAAPENRDGVAATVRIVTAQTGEEAQALLQERGVTHLILPSWDQDLRQFARLTLKDANDAFITAVHEWALPSWLQPLPYPMPVVPGFENESIVVLRVTDETNRATALARMVEYFLETNRPELADAAGEALRKFPADANALVALGQLQKARHQTAAFTETMTAVLAGLEAGFDRGLPWDRRVSLAILLAQGDRHDRAREQLQRCVERLEEERMLNLTTGALYRLQVLARAYHLPIVDPALHARARELLPEPLRARLEP